ncbi:MAG: T9SS type A sorting domain-containing protein, partial [Actinobacteria bacterium]|nr:T9SS type A sorting domain-containing protein [Actinomycetota bacterium]
PAGPFDVAVAPNPFNPRTTVTFSLAAFGDVRAGVYDLLGRQVATLADRRFGPGDHALQWNGRDAAGRPAPSGVYFVRLATAGGGRTEKMMLVR